MRKNVLSILLFASCTSLAQEAPAPHEALPDRHSVKAHHVRLEGSANPESSWEVIRGAQEYCTKHWKPVELPPANTVLTKLTIDEYYTETHFISFKKTVSTFINAKCELESKTSEKIEVEHPFGHCSLNPDKKQATGQCAKSYSGKPLPDKTSGPRQILGADPGLDCKKYQWDLGRLQQTACIRHTGDAWRSLALRGKDELTGLWLYNRIQQTSPTVKTVVEAKAVTVEENIKVSRDMLDLAGTRGYKVVEIHLR